MDHQKTVPLDFCGYIGEHVHAIVRRITHQSFIVTAEYQPPEGERDAEFYKIKPLAGMFRAMIAQPEKTYDPLKLFFVDPVDTNVTIKWSAYTDKTIHLRIPISLNAEEWADLRPHEKDLRYYRSPDYHDKFEILKRTRANIEELNTLFGVDPE
jgi:hypothetical protein